MHHNCARCPALCCNYVSTEIDVPTTRRDFDNIRWYLLHPGVRVYVEDDTGSWFIQFVSRCRFLGEHDLCTNYEARPQICRDLEPTVCEFAQGPGDRYLFTGIEEFERWMQERERRRKSRAEKRGTQSSNGKKTRALSTAARRGRRGRPRRA